MKATRLKASGEGNNRNNATGVVMAKLVILDRSGHRTLAWDKAHADEVKAAADEFEKLQATGFAAFNLDGPGKLIRHFDENAEEIMLVPPLAGG